MFKRKYPNTRLRRLRKNSNLIDLISETNISSNDLIQPIFIKENFKGYKLGRYLKIVIFGKLFFFSSREVNKNCISMQVVIDS